MSHVKAENPIIAIQDNFKRIHFAHWGNRSGNPTFPPIPLLSEKQVPEGSKSVRIYYGVLLYTGKDYYEVIEVNEWKTRRTLKGALVKVKGQGARVYIIVERGPHGHARNLGRRPRQCV